MVIIPLCVSPLSSLSGRIPIHTNSNKRGVYGFQFYKVYIQLIHGSCLGSSFHWVDFILGRFSSRAGDDEHQQLQAYPHLTSPVRWPCLFSVILKHDLGSLAVSVSVTCPFFEPILVASAVDSYSWTSLSDVPTLHPPGPFCSTQSGEGSPRGKLGCSYQKVKEFCIGGNNRCSHQACVILLFRGTAWHARTWCVQDSYCCT